MGNDRLKLQALLEGILGSRNVYFQPPENVNLQYPCIIYSRGVIHRTNFANDKPYQQKIRYTLNIIDANPDSEIPGRIAELPMCVFERHYTSDNLNHDIYNLYY
jgi:hypothetical protein